MTAVAGIVRTARRPLGWRAPGPPPASTPDAALGPHAGEDLCHLAGDWRILQQIAGHRWSLDDLMTAWVAATVVAARPPTRFVDIGCGIGTVLMLLAWRFPEAAGIGIEAQTASVDLARRSLAWNGAADRCEVRGGDFRDPGLTEAGAFDLVTGTPPYLTPGQATASHRAQCGPCHFEERGGVEAYCTAAARLLAPDGAFAMCAAVFQGMRVEDGTASAGLVETARVHVVPKAGKPPLFSVHVLAHDAVYGLRKDASVAGHDLPATLVVRDAHDQWTDDFRAVRVAMGMPAGATAAPRTPD